MLLPTVTPRYCRCLGDRPFATAAGPRIWNGLPGHATSATSLVTFRRKLESTLYFDNFTRALFCDCLCRVPQCMDLAGFLLRPLFNWGGSVAEC